MAVSHVFYLSGQPKSFFLHLKAEQGHERPIFVLILLSKELDVSFKNLQLHPELFCGREIRMENLKRSTLSMSKGQVKVLLVGAKSTLVVGDEKKAEPLFDACVTYQGIVTHDKCVDAGIFVVDNRVTVVMSTLCVITNVKSVQSGSKVVVRNGHMKRLPNNKFALLLCAKGRVDCLDDNSNAMMHSKRDHMKFEANHTVQMCLHLKLSAKQLLAMYQSLSVLETSVKQFKTSNMKEKMLLSSSSDALSTFFDFVVDQVPHRSLLNEFLSFPHHCSIDVPDGSENWPISSNLENVKRLISDALDYRKEFNDADNEANSVVNVRKCSPCSFKYFTIDSNEIKDLPTLVIGYLQINAESGQFEITDNTAKIEVVFEKILPKPGYFLRIKKFVACQEVSTVGRYAWTYFYLIITEFQLLDHCQKDDKEDPAASDEELLNKWAVKLVSHPLKMGNSAMNEMSLLIAAKNLLKSEEKFLRLPAKLGSILIQLKRIFSILSSNLLFSNPQ